jgi:ubiquinone/menaquinone biosynthesis C-methylase UbiE
MTPNSAGDSKSPIAAAFNQIASDYDNLANLRDGALWLVAQVALPSGARVLDVATGTGWAAIAAAAAVGPAGSVVGVDFAADMLDEARRKIDGLGLANIEFRLGDAQQLDFPDDSFDAVICAAGLFFVPDMARAVREWARVVKPGGQVAFTSFGEGMAQPLRSLLDARLRSYGIATQPANFMRLTDPVPRALLGDAGLIDIEVRSEQRGYYLQSADSYWQSQVWSSVRRATLMRMTQQQLEQFKAEHLAEAAALATPQGIWFDFPLVFACGWKRWPIATES